jgi:hypothetical protein
VAVHSDVAAADVASFQDSLFPAAPDPLESDFARNQWINEHRHETTHKGTSMKLLRNQYCPIHHSLFCCGREKASKAGRLTMGVERIDDPNHPRGYRELRSPAELRKVLTQKISAQHGNCGICHLPFTDCNDIVPDHIEPKGMGAARRDDHPDNIQAAHRLCNLLKGSRRPRVA